MIHVVAEIRLVPGTQQQFLAEFGRLVPEVRAEDGCIEYAGAMDFPSGASVQATVRDDLVTVIEKWRDVAALEAHGSARHMAAYRKRVAGFVKATTVYVLRSVAEPG